MKKSTAPKPFCLVLMPYNEEFNDVYQLGIKDGCSKASTYCERVDEQTFGELILDRIYNQIAKADIIIADMTGRNPNVFYEVGYAHALGKRTILLTQNADNIPFNLKHYPHIVYESGGITALRDKLQTRVESYVENPSETVGIGTIGIDLFLGKENLSSDDVVFHCGGGAVAHPTITIHNTSPHSFPPGSFKLGILTSDQNKLTSQQIVDVISLPNGQILNMVKDFPKLFPQQYTSQIFHIRLVDDEATITLRVFTDVGTRDYKLTLAKPKRANKSVNLDTR